MSVVSITLKIDITKKELELKPDEAELLMPEHVKDAFTAWYRGCNCDGKGGSITIRYNGIEYSAYDAYWD